MFELYASLTAPSRGLSEELDAVNAIDQAVLEPLRIAFASLGSCNKLLNDLASLTDFSQPTKQSSPKGPGTGHRAVQKGGRGSIELSERHGEPR
jgi:hypothetical protein